MLTEGAAIAIIYLTCAIGFAWSAFNASAVMSIKVEQGQDGNEALKDKNLAGLVDIGTKISNGANAFLKQEYTVMTIFFLVFSVVVFVLVDILAQEAGHRSFRLYATISYIIGAITSILCGLIGMKIAVSANFRTTFKAITSLSEAFNCAFQSGCVMGFSMVSISLAVLLTIFLIFKATYDPKNFDETKGAVPGPEEHTYALLFDLIAGYGLGGSSMALFGRVGGGIYTKAADVGADLVGKVEENLAEDSPRNPATIADNVGDNVGDIAGMGADLFGSFAEATCAALVLIGGSYNMVAGGDDGNNNIAIYYPMLISAVGIICSLISSAIGIYGYKVTEIPRIEKALNLQLLISTFLILVALYFTSMYSLPDSWDMNVRGSLRTVKWWYCYVATSFGLVSGFLIGLSTDYYTSAAHFPVQEMGNICTSGAAINIIYGLALGYLSTIIPVLLLALTIIVGTYLLGMLGVALAAIGMLSNLCICLAIDAYGPISDNAGGIAEMCEIGDDVRAKTDALDAAGNTTAAVGKGFAIGSAALVSLALYGAFLTRCSTKTGKWFDSVQVNDGWIFGSMLIGAMLPYFFSALTMKSVGRAANEMVREVRRQFQDER
jgi:H(+)-translocating pyrophosphatase